MGIAATRFWSVATLVVYTTINVVVVGLHHHADGHAQALGQMVALGEAGPQLASAPCCDANELACPICKVLHQSKTLSAPVAATRVMMHRGDVAPLMLCPPHSAFRSSTQPRAPPLV